MSGDCNPPCGQSQSCCVIQYPDGTYSAPFCKSGSCYTSTNKKCLVKAKELDLKKLKPVQVKGSSKAKCCTCDNGYMCNPDNPPPKLRDMRLL